MHVTSSEEHQSPPSSLTGMFRMPCSWLPWERRGTSSEEKERMNAKRRVWSKSPETITRDTRGCITWYRESEEDSEEVREELDDYLGPHAESNTRRWSRRCGSKKKWFTTRTLVIGAKRRVVPSNYTFILSLLLCSLLVWMMRNVCVVHELLDPLLPAALLVSWICSSLATYIYIFFPLTINRTSSS